MYNGDHAVIFGDKHSWKDWHLIPTSRPIFNPPSVKTNYIELPGANGILDLSEAITGYPLYGDRQGSMEFIVANDYGTWHKRYSEIMSYLHGKIIEAVLEEDRYYVYRGRFTLNEWRSDPNWSIITIDYDVYPFKLEPNSSLEPWKWDPFNFETGIIREYGDLTVDGTFTLKIPGSQDYRSPTFIATNIGTNGLTVKYNNTTYTLQNGANHFPGILVKDNEITLLFTGNGKVSVDFRGGRF